MEEELQMKKIQNKNKEELQTKKDAYLLKKFDKQESRKKIRF